jgi:hypothetical protein
MKVVDSPPKDFSLQNFDSEVLKDKLFLFTYRPKHRVQTDIVAAKNLTDARKRCIDFCNRHNVTFVYVKPFLLNLDAGLRDSRTGLQPEKEPEPEPKEVIPSL